MSGCKSSVASKRPECSFVISRRLLRWQCMMDFVRIPAMAPFNSSEASVANASLYQCKNPFVCCLFIFIYIFVSRSFPLPSAFLSTDIERGKVFGLNTLRRRKIQSETACRLTFQLSRAIVLPSQTSKGKGRMMESGNSYIAD